MVWSDCYARSYGIILPILAKLVRIRKDRNFSKKRKKKSYSVNLLINSNHLCQCCTQDTVTKETPGATLEPKRINLSWNSLPSNLP